ncbi:diaminobutyrate acetyltransferase [Georgenia satyanarayanai]|nr:diaminobutyrate acetyltransferase [Georgenia satyanarayanai]
MTVRPPRPAEGADMWRLARDSGALDLNTSYAYLLLARDFARTCRVAVVDGEVVGFLLGYRRPEEPDTLFVWQVAVDPAQRGRRLAARLLADVAAGARFVEASITADNTASQRLFESFAAERGAPLVRSELFAAADFPDAGHETEGLVRIGPLEPIES